ncbi:hypothetical protein GCM10022409_20540 [Hymenobacter glaciei]|uniref:Prolyl 4-hydroxylase alpha subunit domain-containing protein n=1 Tax=Hymenobacter glaciei TaxID=877209 RepID=A0ABP7U487_9BACT
MNNALQVIPLLPGSELICFVVRGAFSLADCAALLPAEVRDNFESAHANYPTYYRNNDRLVVDSPELAAQLLATIRPVLPAQLPADSGTDDAWQLRELNPRLRYCRYSAGQYFHRHLDGVYHHSATVQSRLTFMIYLNDATEFTGGRTLFYRSKTDTQVWAEYQPVAGDLIVFDHRIWHEGEELAAGQKFVLRTDILYQTTAALAATTDHFGEGHQGYIWQVKPFGPHHWVSGGRDTLLKVWDAQGHCVQRLSGHEKSILCLAQLNERQLVSGSRDATIRVWTQSPNGLVPGRVLRPHQGAILTVARLSDTELVSGGADGLIQVSNVADGKVLRTLAGHHDWVWQVLPLPGGRLVSCSEDGTLKTWNLVSGECLHSQSAGHSPAQVLALARDARSELLLSGHFDGRIQVWRPAPDGECWTLQQTWAAHEGIVRTLCLLADGRLASGGEDNTVRVWTLTNGQCDGAFPHADFVQAVVAFRPGWLLSASYDGTLKAWPLPAAGKR